MRSRAASLFTLTFLLLSLVPVPAAWGAAPDKAAMYAEMLALAAQMEQLKPQVGASATAAADYAAAETRYRELSAALGGDDPGRLGSAGAGMAVRGATQAPPPPQFCTAATASFSNNTPVAISTGAPPIVVSSTINVAGAGTYLFDVEVTTAITHTFAGDLDVTIQSPAGTVVTLTTDNGGTNDNVFNGTVWDDDANPAGQVPYTNNNGLVGDHAYVNLTLASPLAPEEALAAFIGENPNGTWTITISDDASGDGGSLDSWSLGITTLDQTPVTAVTLGSNNTPVAIGAGAPPIVVSSTINVAGAGTYLFDVDATTGITHTFPGDLDVTIQSPAGTVVTLTTDNGGTNDNVFNGTVWDDDANPAGQVPYTNNNGMAGDHAYLNLTLASLLAPEEGLGAFIGEDPNGTWTITISDDATADGGSLDSWSLQLTTATCTPPSADIQIIKTASVAGNVNVGDPVVFTLTVTNNGPGPATGVTATDTLPAGLAYVSNDCGASYAAPTLTWAIGNLAAAGSAVCNVTTTAAAAGVQVNTATVTANESDPLTTNNSDTITVNVLQSVLEIPTLDGIGLAALALLLAGAAFLSLRRRRA